MGDVGKKVTQEQTPRRPRKMSNLLSSKKIQDYSDIWPDQNKDLIDYDEPDPIRKLSTDRSPSFKGLEGDFMDEIGIWTWETITLLTFLCFTRRFWLELERSIFLSGDKNIM